MPSGSAASRGDFQRVNIGCGTGENRGAKPGSESSHWGIADGLRSEESAESPLREDAPLCCHSSLNCKTTPLLSLPKNCSGAVRWLLRIICGGGKGVKCCSETQVLQPARQTQATFPSQNKTMFAVGSVATKALHRVSLSLPRLPHWPQTERM